MPDPEQPTEQERPAWAVAFERRLAQMNGDATRLAEQLYRDNYEQREELRTLRAARPADGAVVLSPEQAAHWQAYQQLGTPEALTTERTQAQHLQERAARLEREQTLRRAAEVANLRPNVLARLPDLPAVEVQEGETPSAFAVPADGQRVALTDYVAQHYADFLPALTSEAHSPASRTPYPAQANGKTPTPPNPALAYIKKTYK